MAKRKGAYPGIKEAEQERSNHCFTEEEPDWISGAPNYDKFSSMTQEEVLVWLNID